MSPGWAKLKAYIIWRDRGRCHICGEYGADTADHITPRARGGSDDPSNLRAAHIACNRRRGVHAIKVPIAKPTRFV